MLPHVSTPDNYDLMGWMQPHLREICEDTMHLWTPLTGVALMRVGELTLATGRGPRFG